MKTNLLTLSICLAAGVTAMAATNEEGGFKLLNNLRTTASVATTHATGLEAIAATPSISWQSNAYQLDRLKGDINKMGVALAALEKMRDSLTPAEREEVDQSAPLLKQMATDTTSAIRYIKNVQGEIWRPSYQKSVEDLATVSGRLSHSLKEFVELTRVHEKEAHLQKDLGAAGF